MLKNNIFVTIIAAVVACFVQQAWWIRGIEGAAFGFAAFASIPAVYSWAKNLLEPVEITVNCAGTAMPSKLPATGVLMTIMLYPGGGGSTIKTGEAGDETGWPPSTPAYKCEVRNLSGKVLPPIKIMVPIEYRERDGSPLADQQKRFGRISIIAPRIGANSEQPFEFYIIDPRDFGATITKLEAEFYGEPANRPPITIKSNLLFPIGFGMAAK